LSSKEQQVIFNGSTDEKKKEVGEKKLFDLLPPLN